VETAPCGGAGIRRHRIGAFPARGGETRARRQDFRLHHRQGRPPPPAARIAAALREFRRPARFPPLRPEDAEVEEGLMHRQLRGAVHPADLRPLRAGDPQPEAEGAFGGYEEPLPETGPMPAVGEKSIGRFTTRYEYGSDNFDMSFSIQLPDNTYLGECGVGVGEILLDQPHQHVGAFEAWLFDKDDIQTVTKLLVSEALADNPDAIAALSERGEIIVAREGETFELETASLRVRARVRSLKYGDNPALEPNSYFERLELELEPFQKADGGGGIEY